MNVGFVNLKGVEFFICVMIGDNWVVYVIYVYVKVELIEDVFYLFGVLGDDLV